MNLPISTAFETMEGLVKDELPTGDNWVYEPKWDGFRCLVFRDGDEIELMSRSQKPLARYFPDVVAAVRALKATRFVLDGEIVIPHEDRLSFERLLLRIHPAASRVNKLAAETPAVFVAFDILLSDTGDALTGAPFAERRRQLEKFARQYFTESVRISPETREPAIAKEWLYDSADGLDGVMAKKLDLTYRCGERAMIKVKRMRTADCVVAGFRYASKKKVLGSLLLGLYDDAGVLHHVGHTSSFSDSEKVALTPELEKVAADAGYTGFSGNSPGGQSRWSKRESDDWVPLPPRLVAEVRYDHFSEGRFRHATGFLRWRPDKDARHCTFDQIETEGRSTRALLAEGGEVVMGVVKEFREFAMKGNVVDMAVGIIIGASFGAIVKSFVDDILMPPIGMLLGGIQFEEFHIVLKEGVKAAGPYASLTAAKEAEAVTLNYGLFLNSMVTFVLTALAVFMLVKAINRLRRNKQADPAAPTDKPCPYCAMSIPVLAKKCPHCTSALAD